MNQVNASTYTKGCEYEGFVLTKSEYTGADICREYAIDCDLNEDHPLCNGEERTDGIKVCDEPDHPGYNSVITNESFFPIFK